MVLWEDRQVDRSLAQITMKKNERGLKLTKSETNRNITTDTKEIENIIREYVKKNCIPLSWKI